MSHKVERLVNLTVALLEARQPMTFAQIRAGLHAYDQDDPDSARRMFERDKDDLRNLGVPVETGPIPRSDEVGYTIDRERYALPELELSAEEVAALAIALQVTGEERARLGLVKLAARAPDPHGDLPAPHAQVSVGAEQVEDVAEAIVSREPVGFRYRSASGQETERTVDPYAVVQRRGHWYLVGRDHDRDDVRAFRLDRCASPPRPSGAPGTYDIPADLDVDEHVAGPAEPRADIEVALSPQVAWEAGSRGGRHVRDLADGWAAYRFERAQPHRTVSWALGLGAEAEVTAPPALRERALAHLRAMAERTL